MSTSQIVWCGAGAALLFWIVGAYNRLVQMRGTLVQRFGELDRQLVQRHGLLQRQVDALVPMLPNALPRLQALRAACQQLDTARSHARQRPGVSGHIANLRLADDILGESRARLPVQGIAQGGAGADLGELNAALTAVDAALAFARRHFNEAVIEYNRALAQFPTLLVVGLFGFRRAGQL